MVLHLHALNEALLTPDMEEKEQWRIAKWSEVQQHTLLYENTLNVMISQLVKIIPGNTSSLFPISRKGYPVKPSGTMFKTNKKKSCWSNTTKLSYLLHMILYQPKDYTGFNDGWIYEAAVKHDSLSTISDWRSPSGCSFQETGESMRERITL